MDCKKALTEAEGNMDKAVEMYARTSRLDLDNKKKLVTLEGSSPDMIHPPKGSAICSRCPYAMNICAEYEPETVDAQDGSDKHHVACWLSDPRADRTGVPFQIGGAVHA